jgi:hypothetical protein
VIFVTTYATTWDTIGRVLASKYEIVPKKWYLQACIIRALIFSTTFVLAYEGVCKTIFGSDTFILINLALFASSCGCLTSLGMKYGSDEATGDRGLAGTIMGICLTFGIFLGSTSALIFFK